MSALFFCRAAGAFFSAFDREISGGKPAFIFLEFFFRGEVLVAGGSDGCSYAFFDEFDDFVSEEESVFAQLDDFVFT